MGWFLFMPLNSCRKLLWPSSIHYFSWNLFSMQTKLEDTGKTQGSRYKWCLQKPHSMELWGVLEVDHMYTWSTTPSLSRHMWTNMAHTLGFSFSNMVVVVVSVKRDLSLQHSYLRWIMEIFCECFCPVSPNDWHRLPHLSKAFSTNRKPLMLTVSCILRRGGLLWPFNGTVIGILLHIRHYSDSYQLRFAFCLQRSVGSYSHSSHNYVLLSALFACTELGKKTHLFTLDLILMEYIAGGWVYWGL